MAVGHLTYLDLTKEQRAMAATRVREQVRTALANPFLTVNQRAVLRAQIDRITKWEHGHLAIGAPFVLPSGPDDDPKS